MKITILADGKYKAVSKDIPIVGVSYLIEDAKTGTSAQGRAFHALLLEYYKSGLWSYQGSGYNLSATFEEFKKIIKRGLGAGFEFYVYADIEHGKPIIHKVSKLDDIPEYIRKNPDYKTMIQGILKSWADYTKEERKKTIDALISEMVSVGINSPKFAEIIDGMGSIKE